MICALQFCCCALSDAYSINIKVRVKLSVCMSWRHLGERRYIVQYIFYYGSSSSWVVSFTLQWVYIPERAPWYPLKRGCLDLRASRDDWEKRKNLIPLPGMQQWFLSQPAHNKPIASSLYQLCCPGCIVF